MDEQEWWNMSTQPEPDRNARDFLLALGIMAAALVAVCGIAAFVFVKVFG